MDSCNIIKTGDLQPVREKERPKCPFYGFFGAMGSLMDQSGNQCALITGSYSPCQMEIRGETPSWEKCSANTPESRSTFEREADSLKAFPDEFNPKGPGSWKGIPFRQWYQHVMGKPL